MAPTVVNVGAVATGTTSIAPPYPASILANDILLNICESIGGENYGVPSGWAHASADGAPTSPVVEGINTQLTVFWRRYDGTGAAPTLTGITNHGIGRMIAIRGCPLTGNPWNILSTAASSTSSTSASFPGVTTTVPDTLILEVIATGADVSPAGTTQIGALTNANYTSITERIDDNTPTGNGGVIGLVSGIKATAGATGSSALTLTTAATKAMMTIAMMNAPVVIPRIAPRITLQAVNRAASF